ncbi:hemin importer ATP-binding subunit [Actinobacillus ureae]|uniref:Hemin import ATP-binding protein HmuV n=1 Tax=Actinobacillus ureae ATCC 25976 TaxID=887324 RepID=E8KEK9_9PAST|nr:heme ABC transporter ATP-binding protein [Actinobacillus ureae]EFX92666.1 hemin import ATP-binding protein HmuV [Actinobacillus ureae ATCC 25976]SUT88180.1 hemin importer ATP-binding subunit [Actinobacillus ureae]SUU50046.1 hemin importer ATP-binding subunit [Actinobacillus ureae]
MICKKSAEFDRLSEVLSAKQLAYQIDGRIILQSVNLSLKAGEISVLIGANGAGKSTLLRLLAGYLPLTKGEIQFNQQNLADFRPLALAHQRAVMQQHSQINFPFLAEEVIRMGSYQRHISETDIAQVVTATECQSLLNHQYRYLSGGEQQRIQLARALLQLWQPDMRGKILFLDEPTSAFDLHYQQHCLRLLRKLCDERGLTVCAILHDLNLATLYGDRLMLLAEGTIQVQGSPQAVINQANIAKWYRSEVAIVSHCIHSTPQVMLLR